MLEEQQTKKEDLIIEMLDNTDGARGSMLCEASHTLAYLQQDSVLLLQLFPQLGVLVLLLAQLLVDHRAVQILGRGVRGQGTVEQIRGRI